jgi:aminopeptidase
MQKRFAKLLVKIGLNVQNGQNVVLWKAPVESQSFIHMIVEECYRAGAANVDVFWFDSQLDRLRMAASSTGCCAPRANQSVLGMKRALDSGASILLFDCTCAGVFDEIDAIVVSRETSCEARMLRPVWEELSRNHNAWTVTAIPSLSWAKRLYPEEPAHRALLHLWEDFVLACRLDSPAFESVWVDHIERLTRQANLLNDRRYSWLHYRGPKADLRVKLPAFHLWRGPSFSSTAGISYVPDIPMEEVFTLPHRSGADGWIVSDVPFVVNGEIISGMMAKFENGIATEVTARQGERILNAALDTDEGGRRLGEVALVSGDSPVRKLGKLYYNTILDENKACHIAFGRAYRFTAKQGAHLSDQEFTTLGGNISAIHIDFMIDDVTTEIWGILEKGGEERIFP